MNKDQERTKLVEKIINMLSGLSDENRISFAKISFPTSMEILGVVSANEKLVLKELRALTSNYSGEEKIEVAKRLVKTRIFECQHIAYEYLGKDKNALVAMTEKDLDDLDENLDNWVSVDCFAGYLAGYLWREGKIKTARIKAYLKSDDVWRRRIAPVSTVALNQKARGGHGDAKRTLEICSLVVNDHHDKMNKALSWALRELAKRQMEPVQHFIIKYEKRLHPRVLREVKNKLEKGTKN